MIADAAEWSKLLIERRDVYETQTILSEQNVPNSCSAVKENSAV